MRAYTIQGTGRSVYLLFDITCSESCEFLVGLVGLTTDARHARRALHHHVDRAVVLSLPAALRREALQWRHRADGRERQRRPQRAEAEARGAVVARPGRRHAGRRRGDGRRHARRVHRQVDERRRQEYAAVVTDGAAPTQTAQGVAVADPPAVHVRGDVRTPAAHRGVRRRRADIRPGRRGRLAGRTRRQSSGRPQRRRLVPCRAVDSRRVASPPGRTCTN